MKTKFGLDKATSGDILDRLNTFISDLQVLYVKTLRCHWNMEDPRFFFLHKLLDDQYHQLAEDIDSVAERMRAVGGFAPGSLREFIKHARLKEMDSNPSADAMLKELAESYEQLILLIRKDISAIEKKDLGTADLLIKIVGEFEKQAWILRSHL